MINTALLGSIAAMTPPEQVVAARHVCFQNGMTYMDLPDSMLTPAEQCWKQHRSMADQLAMQHLSIHGTIEGFSYSGDSSIK